MENEAKSHSTVCMENSEWVAENIKGIDEIVKEMEQLVENHGRFRVEKLDDDDRLMHLALIDRVKEISHRHHLLAHHYNKQLTDSQLNHPFLTPSKKLVMHNAEAQEVVGSDISLSSGGGIWDTTPIEGYQSSSLSSGSDSESCNSSPIERLDLLPSEDGGNAALTEQVNSSATKKDGVYDMMLMRLSEYEKDLKVSKEKLVVAEEEIAQLKRDLLRNEALMIEMESLEAQLVSAQNQIKLYEADIEKENQKTLMNIVDLETELMSEKRQVEELQESVKDYTQQLSDSNSVIKKLNFELQDASGCFALEKWQLESSISKLSEQLTFHEGRANELQKQCESLKAEKIEIVERLTFHEERVNELQKQCELLEAEKIEIVEKQEALQISWQDNIELVKTEVMEKNSVVDALNKNLDELKLNYDTLMAEKEGVDAKLQTLNADLSVRDDQIQCFELELKSTDELKSRILELEEEVGMQAVMISDAAEGKREAIRQLCFSLDYFRSSYQELREEYAIRKQPAAMVS